MDQPGTDLLAADAFSLEAARLLAFNACMSFAVFAAEAADHGALLQQRYAESRLVAEHQAFVSSYPEMLNIIALVTEEDPDTIAVLPIIARLVDAGPRLALGILSDEASLVPLAILAPELDLISGLQEWDLPQFFLFDEDWELQESWGPRPAKAEPKLEAWLNTHPDYEALAEDESAEGRQRFVTLTQTLTQEMRIWYNSSLDKACQADFCTLLAELQSVDEGRESENEN